MKIEDYEELVSIKKADQPVVQLLFVDFKLGTVSPTTSSSYPSVIGPDVFTKNISISKPIDEKQMKKDYLDQIKFMSLTNQELREEKLNRILNIKKEKIEDYYEDGRKLLNRILYGSNMIAAEGRIGTATHLVVSQRNYDKYPQTFKMLANHNIKIVIEDISNITLYRKTGVDQPGLILVYTDNYYKFEKIGFFPEKQFHKIIL